MSTVQEKAMGAKEPGAGVAQPCGHLAWISCSGRCFTSPVGFPWDAGFSGVLCFSFPKGLSHLPTQNFSALCRQRICNP